jgi:hypothetical protein
MGIIRLRISNALSPTCAALLVDHRRAVSLDQLAAATRKRYDQTGKINDVEEISLHREPLQLRPTGHPDRLMSLNNLAKIVRVLFEMLGQTKDIVISTTQSLPHREPQCRVAAQILSVNCYNPRDTCIGRSCHCY